MYSIDKNGFVFVTIILPSIEEFIEEDRIEIGNYLPNQIDDKLIVGHVATFLDEMIKWEKTDMGL